MLQQTPALLPALAQVLSPPTEQLKDGTRAQLLELVRYLHKQNPGLVARHESLRAVVEG